MQTLDALAAEGQSLWLDYIRRSLIKGGDLARLTAEGVRGVTSNPSIFEKAIGGSDDYDEALTALLDDHPHAEPTSLFEQLAVEDIRETADVLRPIYEATDGIDGYVSLEVSPTMARETGGTVVEARRLWAAVDRPNLMIKVPATPEGVPAAETLIGEGINVNVTLLFSLEHYEAVAHAYLRGLEKAAEPARAASVASFFVSRVDTAVDRRLEAIGSTEALALRGTIAVANARLAYRRYQELFEGDDFAGLHGQGARPQRLLWASTGTKNPAYSDVLYVEELIGRDTVNTVPPATLEAFRDHGRVRGASLTEGVAAAEASIESLAAVGVDLRAITAELQEQGVTTFAESFQQLLDALADKGRKLRTGVPDVQVLRLGDYAQQVDEQIRAWADQSFVRRLWAKDYTLWSAESQPEIVDRLGWLTLPEAMHDVLDDLSAFADEVRADGNRHVVLMGMGGSSLAPEVYQRTFGNRPGYPELVVVDSTHPDAVRAVGRRIDPASTLFLLSSKSGTTVEPLSLFRYFSELVSGVTDEPGRQFVAVTDPGTPLVDLASERGFRRVFEATADVGGRYSALTAFGLVPAALIGVDLHRLVARAAEMSEAAAFCVAAASNPALELGAALGVMGLHQRDKATFLVSSSLAGFPSWVEQLIAESTGKDNKGVLPVADETAGPPDVYGNDRFFVYLAYEGDDDAAQAARVDALEAAGHPVARIRLAEKEDLGREIYRAEFAVASAGAVLGIHPFNQPDVQLAKELARKAMNGPSESTPVEEVRADDELALMGAVSAWLDSASAGDYLALQAFIAPEAQTTVTLQRIRQHLRDRLGLATTFGYGPRFLHSTGQFHKGGPNNGLFLQIVDQPPVDLDVPKTDYTFGRLISAQALGDYQALVGRERRVLRVQLGNDLNGGLAALEEAFEV